MYQLCMHKPPNSFATTPLDNSFISSLEPWNQDAVQALLQEGEARNTRLSYRSAMRYWAAWHKQRFDQPLQLPLDVNTVLKFMVEHTEYETPDGLVSAMPQDVDAALVAAGHKQKSGAISHNTLVHRISVLSKFHQFYALPNPCQDYAVREMLARIRRAYARRGALVKKKDALTKDVLKQLLATCDDSLRGLRDKALLLFAWSSGGRRRSEITSADMRYLRVMGSGEYIYTLSHSKTNQYGIDVPENHKPVTGLAAQALRAWLEAAQIHEGPIFRSIRKGGHVGKPLAPDSVRKIVQQRCAQAKVKGDFSAHSLRSGFVTEAGRQNVPLFETMALTGHRSVNSVIGYYRADIALRNPSARLMDSGERR